MIFHAVAQNTPEWERLRLGIPCSSEFHRIITPKTMQLSKQAPSLMYRLLAEWVTGEKVENYESQFMIRGHEMEDQAFAAYELLTDTETQPGGFITTDDGLIGCSPDRLIGEDGDLEIKCPLLQTQIQYALTGTIDEEYKTQLQGRLMIHGRKYVDIFSYHPRLSIPPLRVKRDDAFIKELSMALKSFNKIMLENRLQLERRFGPFVRPQPDPEADHSQDMISDDDVERILEAQRSLGPIPELP